MKRYFVFFFFICFCIPSYANGSLDIDSIVDSRRLHLDPTWQALLHETRDEQYLRETLLSTLEELSVNEDSVCQYPARYTWLKRQIPELPARAFSHCKSLSEYLRRVPNEQLSLVLAQKSADVLTASMGHILLNLEGYNASGEEAAYSFSYYTDTSGKHASLLFDVLTSGRDGKASLNLYEDEKNFYLEDRRQNLWRYELDVPEETSELIYLHVFELLERESEYRFHTYNCSTILNYTLALAEPSLLNDIRAWNTPHYQIRASAPLIRTVSFEASLSENEETVRLFSPRAYIKPLDNFAERHWQLGGMRRDEDEFMVLSILPMSHDLFDDNRYYSHESGLQLSALELSVNTDSNTVRLEKFHVFANQVLRPRMDKRFRFSQSLILGYEQRYDGNFERYGMTFAELSLGRTYRLSENIDTYILGGGGFGFGGDTFSVYPTMTAGFFLRMGDFGKLRLETKVITNVANKGSYAEVSAHQSIFVSSKSTFILSATSRQSFRDSASENQFSVQYRHYF